MEYKIAVKTPTGVKYLPLDEVTLNGVPLGKILKSIDSRISTAISEVEKAVNKVRIVDKQNTKLNDSNIRLNTKLEKVNKEIAKLQEIDRQFKQEEMVDNFYKFKVDLMLGVLPEPVKSVFDANNANGNRLKELQEWCTSIGGPEAVVMPEEMEIYVGGKLWKRI